MDKWLHKIKALNRGSNCVSSRKIWILADNISPDSQSVELQKHIEKCSICHKEYQRMNDLNQQITSRIPVEKIDLDLEVSLTNEIGQLLKSMNYSENKKVEYVKKTDWFLTHFFNHFFSKRMYIAYGVGFGVYLLLRQYLVN